MRENIHISGDSSPICKRHLESIINYFFPNRLVETSGDCEWTDNIEYTRVKTQDEDKQYRHIKHTHTHYTAHSHMLSPTFRPTLKAPPPPFRYPDHGLHRSLFMPTPPNFYAATFISLILARVIF